MTTKNKRTLKEKDILYLMKESILSFDVLNATEQQARELIAWLQLEFKISEKGASGKG